MPIIGKFSVKSTLSTNSNKQFVKGKGRKENMHLISKIQAHLPLLSFTDFAFIYKLKARPSTNKKVTTLFVAILSLLWWSGTESAIFLRYASSWIWERYAISSSIMYFNAIFNESFFNGKIIFVTFLPK